MTDQNGSTKTALVGIYRGYRTNRYDGYCSSWGLLTAFGATPRAECFAGADDYPGDEFDKYYNGEQPIDFEVVLHNLDTDQSSLNEIAALQPSETAIHREYWGHSAWDISFENVDGQIIATSPDGEKRICDFI